MDREIELTYRLTGHLKEGESVLATLLSVRHGIYAATDQRILCLNNERIGYRLKVHSYSDLNLVRCFEEGGLWFVAFASNGRELAVRARSQREAERFVGTAAKFLVPAGGQTV